MFNNFAISAACLAFLYVYLLPFVQNFAANANPF